MYALGRKADMQICARNVRYQPQADAAGAITTSAT
jgi:hypothetical protein